MNAVDKFAQVGQDLHQVTTNKVSLINYELRPVVIAFLV